MIAMAWSSVSGQAPVFIFVSGHFASMFFRHPPWGPGGWSGGFMLAATANLVDVEEKGGAFIYWPRSHRAVNRFFQRHPERLDGDVEFVGEALRVLESATHVFD